jgi:steroid delta-isomerase-like uncharacterized protein
VGIEQNKEIVRRSAEEPWTGNIGVLDELLAPDYVAYDPSQPEPTRGIAGAKEFVQQYISAFPDARVTIDQQIAEGDYVTSRWTGRGTHKGDLMGIAPTNKQVTVTGITISRIANGKIAEEWSNWDTLGMLQQIGAVPAPETIKA